MVTTPYIKKFVNVKSTIVAVLVVLLVFSSLSSLTSVISTAKAETYTSASVQPSPGYSLAAPLPSNFTVPVVISIPLNNLDQLTSMVQQVSDPSSPSFRQFLTQQQIQQEFLPTSQYQSMLSYLQSIGLPVVTSALDSMIVVRATVAQIKQYLNADVNVYTNGTSSYYITSGNAMLDGAHFMASNASALFIQPMLAQVQKDTGDQLSPNQPLDSITGFSAKDLQQVYNATSLYTQGFQGSQQTVGILDFDGSPTAQQDLAQFDEQYGLPAADLTITPIGTYNPNIGVVTGWSDETSMDIEMAHSMAPNAAIDLYVGDNSLPLAEVIAQIVGLNQVDTLSMSFGSPEWEYSIYGGQTYYFNLLLTDEYFMVGTLQGITFLSSSGDGGGSGFSSGTAGDVAYPSSSPYVTAVGGTQTYFYTYPNGTESFTQTAWSNYGFVPDAVNYGGSGGGVSFQEPKPWYQQSQTTPSSYPNGRLVPDVSLQASLYPATYFVTGGATEYGGGTSESSPLLAGLLTLVAEYSGGRLGLVNPFLYSLGNSPSLYTKAYNPVTFGYTIPWTSSYGYNLATGWGAPNIGEIAQLYKTKTTQSSLTVDVVLADLSGNEPVETNPDQTYQVFADIYNGYKSVTTGSFAASIITLTGSYLTTPLTYNSLDRSWECSLTMGNQSGIAYVDVKGSSNGVSGEGFAQVFAGYLATFCSPSPMEPWTTAGNGLEVIVASSYLNGTSVPVADIPMTVNSYSILSNQLTTVDQVNLVPETILGVPNATAAILSSPYYPAGPLTLMLQGSTFGFLPFTNGIYLQTTFVVPSVNLEPGAVGPGQDLTISTTPVAPVNVAEMTSSITGTTIGADIQQGSNVTALLLNPSGQVVSTADLVYQTATGTIGGELQAPLNASPGLYTILLEASYESPDLGVTLNGSFFGQIWVSNTTITPQISLSPSTLYMGQTVPVTVDIHYANGQEVTQGEYSAAVYPEQLQSYYAAVMQEDADYAQLIPLSYDPSLNRWVGTVTLPSPYNAGSIALIDGGALYYAGPYDIYVAGISYDGVPTTTDLSAQQGFFVQPYVYMANQVVTQFQQTWGLALNGVTIDASANLADDVFVGSNTVQSGATTISDSVINGTLYVTSCNLTLQDVQGGNVVATNSTVDLIDSNLASLSSSNSNIESTSSSIQTITPSPPTIQFTSPSNGASLTGSVNVNFNVQADNVKSVTAYLNGQSIQTFSSNGSLSFTLPTANYQDGTYQLQASVTQTDGITASANITVYFTNQYTSTQSSLSSLNSGQTQLQNQLNAQNSNLGSLNSSLNSTQSQLANLQKALDTLNSTQPTLQNQLGNFGDNLNSSMTTLQNQITTLNNSLKTAEILAFTGIAVGVIAVAVAFIVTRRRGGKPRELTPQPEQPPQTNPA